MYTPIFEITEQIAVKTFFPTEADSLLDDKTYRITESQAFTHAFVRHLIKLSTVSVPLVRFVMQQTEKAVGGEAKFRHEVSQEIPFKKDITPP